MFETGIRQFRMAMAMMWGWHINPRNLERMVGDALRTLEEFGSAGDDVQQLLDGPFTEPEARKEYQLRMLQHTAGRLTRTSPYYSKLFAAHNILPDKLTLDDMVRIPVTCKEDLLEHQRDFLCSGVEPYISTRTTGTTGCPAEIWLSKYEIELWPALAALSGLLRNEVYPGDYWQINISSRATAAVQLNTTTSRLTEARISVLGIVPVEESLDQLLVGDKAPTLLSTYPSYLAQLVKEARRRGLGPKSFRLRRIYCGGEVLSDALRRAVTETLGPAIISDAYGMTEILPMGGRTCNQGHLHYDLNVGSFEVIDLDTGKPAAPGELGTVVITPYYPYRECMPVFRYDTRDVVRNLPDSPLTCELATMSATSNILGKASHVLRVNGQYVTMRDLIEVFEALPSEPWPARFSAEVVDNRIEMTISEEALRHGVTYAQIERRYQEAGLNVRVVGCVTRDQDLIQLRPLRADLLETTFAARRVD
ncbi:MAG TPA: AMP-binding protein [Ktedonobacteraceae bacterium]|nr:AMP-binding protein [Ktedonobacteraceae bacterium]